MGSLSVAIHLNFIKMATKDRIKLVIVGDGSCGKSCLIHTFESGSPKMEYILTVFETYVADIEYEGKSAELQMWDTAGQEDYDRLRQLSYPDTDVILICYNIGMPDTLENVQEKVTCRLYVPTPQVLIMTHALFIYISFPFY